MLFFLFDTGYFPAFCNECNLKSGFDSDVVDSVRVQFDDF